MPLQMLMKLIALSVIKLLDLAILLELFLKPFAEKIANEIENMDESKIEKLGKSLEKVFKRVR